MHLRIVLYLESKCHKQTKTETEIIEKRTVPKNFPPFYMWYILAVNIEKV